MKSIGGLLSADITLPLCHITKSVLYIVSAILWLNYVSSVNDSSPVSVHFLPFAMFMIIVGSSELIVGIGVFSQSKKSWGLGIISTIVSLLGISMLFISQSSFDTMFSLIQFFGVIFLPIYYVTMALVQSPFAFVIIAITCLEMIALRNKRIKRRYKIIE